MSKFTTNTQNRPRVFVIVSIAAGLMLLAGALTATGIVIGSNMNKEPSVDPMNLPFVLKADSSARGKGVSMATGRIDENVEGLFVLDHLTGDLQCWVLNSRNIGAAAIFKANVALNMGNEKAGDGDYVMVTGGFFFDGGNAGNVRPGQCICYVADGNSGKVIGYGLTYNRQAVLRGNTQGGALSVVCRGVTRGAVERDQ